MRASTSHVPGCRRCSVLTLAVAAGCLLLTSRLIASRATEANSIAVLDVVGATIEVASDGSADLVMDMASRKFSTDNIFYVDLRYDGDGSEDAPFHDLPDVFAHLATSGLEDATVYLADGNYSWGDAIAPDSARIPNFSADLNIIGNGPLNTHVRQAEGESAAAVFREPGRSLFIEGIDFVGRGDAGTVPNNHVLEARSGKDLTLINSVVRSATWGDGLLVIDFATVVVHDSYALDNQADGFSYANPFDTTPMYVLESSVVARGNGRDDQSNSQGSTMHRATEIVRVNGKYVRNPTNIEDTGLRSWNINLTVKDPTVPQLHEFSYVNFRVRGDKLEGTNGIAYIISGKYGSEGLIHAHTNKGKFGYQHGTVHFSSVFDFSEHPRYMFTNDVGSEISFTPDTDFDAVLGIH